jgi:hypothetical protein
MYHLKCSLWCKNAKTMPVSCNKHSLTIPFLLVTIKQSAFMQSVLSIFPFFPLARTGFLSSLFPPIVCHYNPTCNLPVQIINPIPEPTHSNSKDWGSIFPRNIGILPQNYTVWHPRRTQQSWHWKHENFCLSVCLSGALPRCLLGPCTAAIDVCPFGLLYISPMIDWWW